jgi:hypothetical protein
MNSNFLRLMRGMVAIRPLLAAFGAGSVFSHSFRLKARFDLGRELLRRSKRTEVAFARVTVRFEPPDEIVGLTWVRED